MNKKGKKLLRKLRKNNKRLMKLSQWLVCRVESLSHAMNHMHGFVKIEGIEHRVECDMHLHGPNYACTCGAEPLRQAPSGGPATVSRQADPTKKPN
jgi:hypothetical protein